MGEVRLNTEKTAVWAIGIYLVAAYTFFGFLTFFTWQQSSGFGLIGWSWSSPNSGTFQRVIYAFCAGGLGATTYSF